MSGPQIGNIQVDGENMYREETYTDLKVASFRRLVPILPDGSPDESRDVIMMGMTHVGSEAGPMPVYCHLEAKTMQEAIAEFPEAAERSLEKMIEEAKQLKDQRAQQEPAPAEGPSKIFMP